MAPDTAPQAKSILVVDDEPGVRTTLSVILSGEGYSVTAASDVHSAAAALEGTDFAAILTDLRMPRPPGIAVVEEVAERGLETPVILMSGSLGDRDAADLRVDRLAGLLSKRICVETLRSLLRTVTERQCSAGRCRLFRKRASRTPASAMD